MPESSGNRFLIDVVTRFQSTGLNELVAEVQKALADLAKQNPVGSAGYAQQAPQILRDAEVRAAQLQVAGKGSGQDAKEFNDAIRTVRRALTSEAQALVKQGVALPAGFEQGRQQVRAAASKGNLIIPGQPQQAPSAIEPTDTLDAKAAAQERIDAVKFGNAVQRELIAAQQEYIPLLAEEKALRLELKASLSKQLAGDAQYLDATVQAANARRELSIAESKALLTNDDAARLRAGDQLNRQRFDRQTALQKAQQTTPQDVSSEAELKALNRALKRREAAELVALQSTQSEVEAEAELIRAQRALARKQTEANLKASAPDIQAEAQLKVAQQRRKAAEEAAVARLQDPSTLNGARSAAQEGRTAAADARRAAYIERVTAEEQAADAKYIENKARSAVAEEERATRIKAQALGVPAAATGNLDDIRAQAAQAEKTRANLRAAAAAKAVSDQDIAASVQRRASDGALNRAILQREKAYIKDAIATGAIPSGTRFQNLKAALSPTAQVPQDFQTLGQFVGSKVTNTVGYAIGGAALFGSISAIKTLLTDAEELQKVMQRVKAQFDTLGESNQFGPAREAILSIAKETGAAAADVADVFFQFKGAFGDTSVALENTAAAMKLVQVTGISLAESIDSLTAISKTFGTSITEVGDLSIGLEERFGVLAKETIAYLGDTAAVAKDAGLSLADTAAIGAAAQQASGRAGSANAEALNRILPSLQNAKEVILEAYQKTPALASRFGALLDAFSQSKSGVVLKQIIQDFNTMDAAQQQQLIHAIGGRREAQALIPILQQSAKLQNEFAANADGSQRDAGKLNARFKDFTETVSNAGQRLNQVFKGLGQAIFNLGLADVITQFANAIGIAVSGVTKLISLFGTLNGLVKIPFTDSGLLGALLQMTIVATLVAKAISFLTGERVKSIFTSRAEAAAEATNAGAKIANAEATTGAATAEGVLGTARGKNILTTEAQTAVNKANGVGKTGIVQGFFGAGGLGRRAFTQGSIFSGGGAPNISGLRPANAGEAVGGGALVGAVAIAGAFAVADAWQKESAKVQEAAKGFRESLKNATTKQLEQIADKRSDFTTKLAAAIFGTDLPEAIAAQEFNKRASQGAVDQLNLLRNDTTPGQTNLKDLTRNLSDANKAKIGDLISKFTDLGLATKVGTKIGPESFDLTSKGINTDALAEALPGLIDKAAGGDAHAGELVAYINDTIAAQTNNESIRQKVQDLVKQKNEADAVKLAGSKANLASLNIQTAKSQRDSGSISTAQYIQSIQQNIAVLEQERRKGGDAFTDQNAQDLANAQNALQTELLARAKDLYDNQIAVNQLLGVADPKQQELQGLILQVNSAGLDEKSKLSLLPQLLQAVSAAFQERLNNIQDPLARAAAAHAGFTIPPEVQALLNRQRLAGDTGFENEVQHLADLVDKDRQSIYNGIINDIQAGDHTTADLVHRAYQQQIDLLQSHLDRMGESPARLGRKKELQRLKDAQAAADAALGGDIFTPAPDNGGLDQRTLDQQDDKATQAVLQLTQAKISIAAAIASADPVQSAMIGLQKANADLSAAIQLKDNTDHARDIAIANAQAEVASANVQIQTTMDNIARANANWATIFANGDPVKVAQAQKSIAQLNLAIAQRDNNQAGIIEAQQAIAQADQAINDALENVRQAVFALDESRQRDPYKAATIRLQAANDALANAKGDAAIAAAQQQVEQAQRDIAKIVDDGIKAQADFAIAVANAAGDTVKAATLSLAEAKRELAKAQAEGAGTAEIAQLQANVVTAAAAQRDAELNTQEKHIDFLLQIGKITTGQAISMLEALRQIPNLTQDELDQITLKIKQLQNDLKGDFKFNLPTNLALPTLYEARRSVQSGGSGSYNDNRQINTTIVVPAGTTQAQLQQIVDAAINPGINAPTVNKKYP